MKKIIYIFIILVASVSCTKNFTSINTDPTAFTKVTPEATIESAIRSLNFQMEKYNDSKFWDMAHFFTTGNNRYDATDAGLFQTMYVNVLENLQQVTNNYGQDSSFNNRVQIARIVKCYTYSILVGLYGPVSLNQANNPDYLANIAYDNEDSVYTYILTNLKDAASKINLSKQTDKLTYDVVYGSDANSLLRWVKFANTLRLKVALRCMRNLGTVATDHIKDVMSNEAYTINSEAEAAKMNHENVSGNENYYYQTYIKVVSGLGLPRLNDFLLAYFRSYQDPRLNVYFDSVTNINNRLLITDTLTSTADDSLRIVTYPIPHLGVSSQSILLPGWTGLTGFTNPMSGASNAVATNSYSPPAAKWFNSPTNPFYMLTYADALFLKAEAAQLGLGGSQAPSSYYYAGITENFTFWGLPVSAATAYENIPGIKWGTAGTGFNNWLSIANCNIPQADINKIWIQSWLSYFPDNGFDAYTLQMRTRVINFPPNTNPGGNTAAYIATPYIDLPTRHSYPSAILTLNPKGFAQALKLLGTNNPDDYYIYIPLHYEVPYTVPDWNAAPASYDMRYVRNWYGSTIQSLTAASKSAGFAARVTLVKTYHP